MPMDWERAQRAVVVDKLAFPCALCVRWWTAVDKGESSCGRLSCGGPALGRTYPEHSGPLERSDWSGFCFICGCPDRLTAVHVPGAERRLAVCSDHLKHVENMLVQSVEGGLSAPAKPVIVVPKG